MSPAADILFAFCKVYQDNEWFFNCVDCSLYREEEWQGKQTRQLYLADFRRVALRIPDASFETSANVLGPEEIYGRDPKIAALGPQIGMLATAAQNTIELSSADDLADLTMPQFFASDMISLSRIVCSVTFRSPYLQSIPDVVAFEDWVEQIDYTNNMEMKSDWKRSTEKTPIPLGLFFPGAIEWNGIETPIAYQIVRWTSEQKAVVDCYLSNRVDLDQEMLLTRRSSAPQKKSVLGTIAEATPIALDEQIH